MLGVDPDCEPERVHKRFESHLARARWMSETGYRVYCTVNAETSIATFHQGHAARNCPSNGVAQMFTGIGSIVIDAFSTEHGNSDVPMTDASEVAAQRFENRRAFGVKMRRKAMRR